MGRPACQRVAANLYSLIEAAKANRIEPDAYLLTVFTELPRSDRVEAIEKLLPIPTTDASPADPS